MSFTDTFHSSNRSFDCVRRRRWIRHRRRRSPIIQPIETLLSNSSDKFSMDSSSDLLVERARQELLASPKRPTQFDAPPFANQSRCQSCSTEIGILGLVNARRRHHCRNCGGSFCAECATRKSIISFKQYDGMGKQRVCDDCYDSIEKDWKYNLDKRFGRNRHSNRLDRSPSIHAADEDVVIDTAQTEEAVVSPPPSPPSQSDTSDTAVAPYPPIEARVTYSSPHKLSTKKRIQEVLNAGLYRARSLDRDRKSKREDAQRMLCTPTRPKLHVPPLGFHLQARV